MDLRMPLMNGIEAIESIRNNFPWASNEAPCLTPSGQFTCAALAPVVPFDFSNTVHRLQPRKVVLLETHAARSQSCDRTNY